MAIFCGILLIWAAIELSTLVVYGPVYKKQLPDLSEYQLHGGDSAIIYAPDLNTPYISIVPAPILFKYYIQGTGVIIRWSKAHKQIKQKFKELKKQQ